MQVRYVAHQLLAASIFAFGFAANADMNAFTFDGLLTDPGTGAPLTSNNVDIKIEILSEDESCVLYSEEHQSYNLSGPLAIDQGRFAVKVGAGSNIVFSANGFEPIFTNAGNYNCSPSGTKTVTALESRKLRVSVRDNNGSAVYGTLSPSFDVLSATNSMRLRGKPASDFVWIQNGLTQANLEAVVAGGPYAPASHNHDSVYAKLNSSNAFTGDLDVAGIAPGIRLTATSGGAGVPKLEFYSGAGTQRASIKSNESNNELRFFTGTTEAMRLDSGQNMILAGTLDVAGFIAFGQYTDIQEATLVTALVSAGPAAIGVTWTNIDHGELRYWDGSATRTVLNSTGEADPTVLGFAKTSLPTCTAGFVLSSNGTSLSCVADASGSTTDASTLTTGILADVRLSGNVPLKDGVNDFSNSNKIAVPTASKRALLLQSTDDNSTQNIFEVQDSTGVAVLTARPDGVPTAITDIVTKDYLNTQVSALGDITAVTAGTGMTGGATSGSAMLGLANTAVTPGTYGNNLKTVTIAVDAQGRLTSAGEQNILIMPDQIASGAGKYFGYMPNNTACSVGETLKWDTTGTAGWKCFADDNVDSTKLPLAGGVVTGAVTVSGGFYANSGAVTMSTAVGGNITLTAGNIFMGTSTASTGHIKMAGTTVFHVSGSGTSTFLGAGAGAPGTTGQRNTGIGLQALVFTGSSGTDNSSVGYMSMRNNSSGSFNTAMGSYALYSNDTTHFNTAIGDHALYDNMGAGNSALGRNAGVTNGSGNSNTYVGNGADAGVATLSGSTAIGAGAVVSQNSSIALGASGVRVGVGIAAPQGDLDVGGTKALIVPRGTSAQQPAGAAQVNGMIRYNSTNNKFEAFENGAWVNMIGGGGGGINTFNGDTSSAQTVGVSYGVVGINYPDVQNSGATHTFRFPAAETAGVTAGLVSNSTLAGKITKSGDTSVGTLSFATDANLNMSGPAAQLNMSNGNLTSQMGPGALIISNSSGPANVSLASTYVRANGNGGPGAEMSSWQYVAGKITLDHPSGDAYLRRVTFDDLFSTPPPCTNPGDEGRVWRESSGLKMCIYDSVLFNRRASDIVTFDNAVLPQHEPKIVFKPIAGVGAISIAPAQEGYPIRVRFDTGKVLTRYMTSAWSVVSPSNCSGVSFPGGWCYIYLRDNAGTMDVLTSITNPLVYSPDRVLVGSIYFDTNTAEFKDFHVDDTSISDATNPIISISANQLAIVMSVDYYRQSVIRQQFPSGKVINMRLGDLSMYVNNGGPWPINTSCFAVGWCYVYAFNDIMANDKTFSISSSSVPPSSISNVYLQHMKVLAAFYYDGTKYIPFDKFDKQVLAENRPVLEYYSPGVYRVRAKETNFPIKLMFGNSKVGTGATELSNGTAGCSTSAWCYVIANYDASTDSFNLSNTNTAPLIFSAPLSKYVPYLALDQRYIGSFYKDGSGNITQFVYNGNEVRLDEGGATPFYNGSPTFPTNLNAGIYFPQTASNVHVAVATKVGFVGGCDDQLSIQGNLLSTAISRSPATTLGTTQQEYNFVEAQEPVTFYNGQISISRSGTCSTVGSAWYRIRGYTDGLL